MITRLRSWLAPPISPADQEKTHVAGVLHTVLLTVLAGLGVYIVFIWILNVSAARLIVLGPLFLVTLGLLLLMRRGYVRLASVVLSISLWAAATAACVISGGVRAPVFSGYVIVVLVAGILLGWRSALGFASLSLVTSLALLYATDADLLPTPFYVSTNTTIWLTHTVFLLWSTVLLSLARRSVDDALRRMRQELTERHRTEAALRESEARYRTLVKNFPNGAVLLFDHDLRYTLAEGAGLAEAGLSSSALEGKTIWEAFAPDVCRIIEPPFRAALEGAPTITDVPFLDRVYRMHTLPVDGASGTVVAGMVMTQDITADKRAEAALKESEERYARLADASFEGLGFSENGLIIDANARLAEILGYRREELIGLPIEQIVAPESRDMVQRRIQTGYQAMYEHLALRKDGTIVPVEVRSRRAQYHGRPIRVTAIRDISERLAAEQALAAGELRFRVAFHANPAPQLLTRMADGFIIDANAAYERLVGYTRNELVGKLTTDLPIWVEWDRAQLLHELQAQRRIVDRATQMRTRSGDVCDVILSTELVQIGETACYMSVMIDVTERLAAERALARSEQMFKDLLQSINAIVWEADAQTFVCSFISEQAEKLLGYPTADWLGSRTFWANHIHPDDREATVGYSVRCTQALEYYELEYRMIAADGRVVWLRDLVTIEAADGVPRRLRGAMVDITERKRAEEALRTYTRRLEYLRDIDQIILTTASLNEIAEVALHRLRALIPCNRAELILTDWEANEAVIVAQVTDRPTSVPVGYRYSLADRPPRPALLDGQIVIDHDLSQDTLASPSLQHLRDEGLRARILVPLLVQGRLIGAIHLAADRPYAPTNDQRSLARELADHLAIGLQSARLLAEVQATNARLSTLSRQLIEAQEAERRRIARELHDEIGQALALIKLNIRAVQQMAHTSDLAPRLEQSLGIIEATLLRVRTLALDLRPAMLDDLGLIAALRWYVDQQAHVSGLAAEVRGETDSGRLPSEIETTCFRVVQEAFNNIVRHAHALRVHVQVEQRADAIRLIIQDDGVGFDAGQALAQATHGTSGGLLGMQERVALCGGQLTIESAPASGTTIQIWIPLEALSASAPPASEEVPDVIDSRGSGG